MFLIPFFVEKRGRGDGNVYTIVHRETVHEQYREREDVKRKERKAARDAPQRVGRAETRSSGRPSGAVRQPESGPQCDKGVPEAYAPRWTDAAADTTWQRLADLSAAEGGSKDSIMLKLLQRRAERESALREVARAGTARDEAVARKVLEHHAGRMQAAKSKEGQHAVMHSCMKQLRGRAGAPGKRAELSVAPATEAGQDYSIRNTCAAYHIFLIFS